MLRDAFISGAVLIADNKREVDELNVYPVPDGDTGTNMSMTVSAAARRIPAVEENSASKVAECISSASLRDVAEQVSIHGSSPESTLHTATTYLFIISL